MQYKTVQIVERINAYFGYRAVTDIRLIQAPLAITRTNQMPAKRPVPAAPVTGAKSVLKASLAKVDAGAFEDADLRQALERLGSAVSAAPHRHT